VSRRLFGVLLTAASLLAGCGGAHTPRELVVGAGTDPDSTVLAELYAAALRYYGSPARVVHMADPIAALDRGEINVMGGFTGDVLQMFAPGTDNVISDQNVYRAMVAALPEGVAAGDYATAAEDKPAVAVTRQTAGAWGDRQLTTLIAHCGRLTMGSVAGTRQPVEVGGCKLPGAHEFTSDAALFAALRAGQIDAAWTSTADPDIPDDVVVLADRRPVMVQAENVVPLYRRDLRGLSEAEVGAINEVAGEFDTSALADMRRQVAQGADPRQVAEGWVAAHPLGR
jgi:glycine betaine/choline ABC-type transport system substrate-binding protein